MAKQDDLIKESVIKILEILSGAVTDEALSDDHLNTVFAQHVISDEEIEECKKLLKRLKENSN